MLSKKLAESKIKKYKIANGMSEVSDENLIATMHLCNSHSLDFHASCDQSSRGPNDMGIDAWYYNDTTNELYLYQSKLSESKALVLRGFSDLITASKWITPIIIEGVVEKIPTDNNSLFNLYTKLSEVRTKITRIHFVLLSLFDENELEDDFNYREFKLSLARSPLNQYVIDNLNGKIITKIESYGLQESLPRSIKKYGINRFTEASVQLRNNSYLHLSYVSLFSLVELYRQRGDILFDKNVRLSLINVKEAKDRLVHPLTETLTAIATGRLSPMIFPFYHIGVTISATNGSHKEGADLFELEAPSVINGCQTITISNQFLIKLEKEQDVEKREKQLELFKKIQVICKVVVSVSDDELKEITNANNRQNPIENWQLFSNEPIHTEIEIALREKGVFYERQKGKFDTVMKSTDAARFYNNTNATYIKVPELGQLIALCLPDLQKAAKPSDIFINEKNHASIFDKSIPSFPEDIVLASNLFKGIKRALKNYLDRPTHANDYTQKIFSKPIVKINIFALAMLYCWQKEGAEGIRDGYQIKLQKNASPVIVEYVESSFYPRVVSKVKEWYLAESQQLTIEPSSKKMEEFFLNLYYELGLDESGRYPFL